MFPHLINRESLESLFPFLFFFLPGIFTPPWGLLHLLPFVKGRGGWGHFFCFSLIASHLSLLNNSRLDNVMQSQKSDSPAFIVNDRQLLDLVGPVFHQSQGFVGQFLRMNCNRISSHQLIDL